MILLYFSEKNKRNLVNIAMLHKRFDLLNFEPRVNDQNYIVKIPTTDIAKREKKTSAYLKAEITTNLYNTKSCNLYD